MSTKFKPKKRCASDKDLTKRKVDFCDYLLLKDSYVELGEKYKKLDEDHKKLNQILKEYQTEISEFQKAKSSINEMFKKMQEKINRNKNMKEIIETKKILELEKEINIKSGEIIKFKEMNLDLENKIKFLEEENNKIKDELSEKNKIIENMKIKTKQLEEDINQKENENLIIINQLNELKEEYENEELSKNKLNNIQNIKNKYFNNLSKEKNINIFLKNSKNKLGSKNNIFSEEKKNLITNLIKSETNSSSNPNKIEILKNINTYNSLNNINETILNNYLNTINIGYNGINNNYKLESENDSNLIIDENPLECEPTPSFILCIKKAKNE